MLRNLEIRNYALIEHLDLEFGPGLTIITGETGAGKSIMLGALGLVMGGRADTRVIADGDSKSVVSAIFTDVDPDLRSLLEERGVEWICDEMGNPEIRVRRELSSSGRSKVYVNDTSVTLQTLAAIVPRLIDIHSQHANGKINDASERLHIIDVLAADGDLLSDYRHVFGEYVEIRRVIESRKSALRKNEENLGLMQFQLQQLSKLTPRKGELPAIERRFEMLSDADEIKAKLRALQSLLGDSDTGVQTMLGEASSLLAKIDIRLLSESTGTGEHIAVRLKDLLVEVKDIYETIVDMDSMVDSDPATLGRLSSRMNLYYEMIKRFNVKDGDALADLFDELKRKVAEATGGDDELPELEREAKRIARLLKEKADQLSEIRENAVAEFSKALCEVARPLGLPNIDFRAEVRRRKLSMHGQDEVEFLCSFNKNGVPKPLGDIASGGEISRMMLSLKAILAGHINLPTIIFDEVDTGVSGEIADKMGAMMRKVSENMQVIVITHLPQVAAKGDEHFKVYKEDGTERTVTHVRKLTMEERIRELAAMISGSAVSEAALEAARGLLVGS